MLLLLLGLRRPLGLSLGSRARLPLLLGTGAQFVCRSKLRHRVGGHEPDHHLFQRRPHSTNGHECNHRISCRPQPQHQLSSNSLEVQLRRALRQYLRQSLVLAMQACRMQSQSYLSLSPVHGSCWGCRRSWPQCGKMQQSGCYSPSWRKTRQRRIATSRRRS